MQVSVTITAETRKLEQDIAFFLEGQELTAMKEATVTHPRIWVKRADGRERYFYIGEYIKVSFGKEAAKLDLQLKEQLLCGGKDG